jgi:hypothetical protein
MAKIIAVKEWDRFQHYKDRDPPWIKLYRDTLTSEAWVLGTDLSRLVQVASTLLAARYSNKIPLKFDLLTKVAHLDCTEADFMAAIEHLIEHNFLEVQEVEDACKQSASTTLASCNTQNATLYSEESREEQRRGREEQTRASASGKQGREGKAEITPEAALAIPLREAGVRVTSIHPLLVAWVRDGFTIDQAVSAVGVARSQLGESQPIAAKYLDTIIRNPPKPGSTRLNGHSSDEPPSSRFDRIMQHRSVHQTYDNDGNPLDEDGNVITF